MLDLLGWGFDYNNNDYVSLADARCEGDDGDHGDNVERGRRWDGIAEDEVDIAVARNHRGKCVDREKWSS